MESRSSEMARTTPGAAVLMFFQRGLLQIAGMHWRWLKLKLKHKHKLRLRA